MHRGAASGTARVILVMGVSGSGKSVVGGALARRLGLPFLDGDDLHPPENLAKMRAGRPLDDADRSAWLAAIAERIDGLLASGTGGVVACSALKRAYRDRLLRGRAGLRLVFLDGAPELIARRLSGRRGHFMPPALLESQLAALERPAPEEDAIAIGIDAAPEAIAAEAAERLEQGDRRSRAHGRTGSVAGGRFISTTGRRHARRGGVMPIALVVSDVDGTLVTPDKTVTPAAVAAVGRLREAGIPVSLCSSRPPFGLSSLVAALGLKLPLGAFNGAAIVEPDLTPIAQTLIPGPAARRAAALMEAAGLDIWVFAGGVWALRDPAAAYVDLERRTLDAEPAVVPDLGTLLDGAAKVVGVSADPARLRIAESDLAAALGDEAVIHRSQPYYLDVTPPGVTKGDFVTWLARRLGLAREAVAAIGDAGNDLAMFEASGVSVAMGNAPPEVKQAASFVTADNESDGFAEAVDRLLAAG